MCYYSNVRRGYKMKIYSSREVIKQLQDDGWYLDSITGSHHHYKHPIKKGKTTVKHPTKAIPPKTLDSIQKQAGIKFE